MDTSAVGVNALAELSRRVRHLETLEYGGTQGHEAVWVIKNTLATGTGVIYIPNRLDRAQTLTRVQLACGTAPTGAAVIVDVNVGAIGALASIFAAPADRPQIAAAAKEGFSTTIGTTSWPVGQYLSVDIDQVGSVVAGSDLTVTVSCTDA